MKYPLCFFLQVREKLLEKKTGMEKREKARKQRDLRKYGKKVLLGKYTILKYSI